MGFFLSPITPPYILRELPSKSHIFNTRDLNLRENIEQSPRNCSVSHHSLQARNHMQSLVVRPHTQPDRTQRPSQRLFFEDLPPQRRVTIREPEKKCLITKPIWLLYRRASCGPSEEELYNLSRSTAKPRRPWLNLQYLCISQAHASDYIRAYLSVCSLPCKCSPFRKPSAGAEKGGTLASPSMWQSRSFPARERTASISHLHSLQERDAATEVKHREPKWEHES